MDKHEVFNQIVCNKVGYIIDQNKMTINECPVIEASDRVARFEGYYGYGYVMSIGDIGRELFLSINEAEEYTETERNNK